jgi:hypothetical protein
VFIGEIIQMVTSAGGYVDGAGRSIDTDSLMCLTGIVMDKWVDGIER